MERGCDQEHTRERGVDLSNSRSSSFILEGAGDPSAVRTRRTLSACRSRVSIAMTGRAASAPRGVGRRRRERRPFLAATLGSALSTLLLVLLLLHAPAPARAHEDSSEPGHASADGTDGYVFEYHQRPPPPPMTRPCLGRGPPTMQPTALGSARGGLSSTRPAAPHTHPAPPAASPLCAALALAPSPDRQHG